MNEKFNLVNWEIVSVNPSEKNWNWSDIFCFWAVNFQSLIGFSLIASLYLVYDLNFFVVFFWWPHSNPAYNFIFKFNC